MAEKCFIDYRNKTKNAWTQQELESFVNKTREELAFEGKTFDTNVDGDLAVWKKIEQTIGNDQKRATQKMMRRLSTNEAINERLDEFRRITKNLKDPKKLLNKFVSMVFNTNDTRTLPFEMMRKTNFKNMFGDFLQKVSKAIEGEDAVKYLSDKKNFGKVMTEYNQFYKNPNAVKSLTGDTRAFRVAKELFDAEFKIAELKRSFGHNTLLGDLRLRPKWSIFKIKKANEEEFINKVANALDDEVHGSIDRRRQLAKTLYNNMRDDKGKWREQGDLEYQNLDADNWIDPADRKPAFAFKDGDSLMDIVNNYADVDMRRQLQLQFDEMARETALVQFLGADYKRGLTELFDEMDEQIGRLGPKSKLLNDYRAARTYLEKFVSPEHLEHNVGASYMTGIRGFMASSKLGQAVITALMDVPAMIYSGKHLFGLPLHKLIGSIFQWGYKGAPSDYAKYAEYMLEGVDTYLGHMADRFGHIGTGAGGAFEEAGSKTANAVFKFSGLNFWTEGRKAMATGIYGKELGNLIKSKIKWDDIRPTFRQNLEKFGINKKDWNNLTTKQPLDANGRLDIFQVEELDFEFSYGKSSLRQKLSATFNDAVDTMVMTPGDYDIAAGALFADPGTAPEQVLKTIFQFKSHPIAYTRKILWRSGKQANSKIEFLTNMSILTTEMMLMGVVVVQLKDFLRGNQPRNWDDGNLWIRAAEQSGAWGLISDTLLQFGGTREISQFTDEPESSFVSSNQKASQLLGPFISDMLKFTDASIVKSLKEDTWQQNLTNTSVGLLNYVPFQNVWWAAMFKRWLIHDYIKQRTDKKSYRRQQKKLKKIAKDNRIGSKPNNIVYDTIFGN